MKIFFVSEYHFSKELSLNCIRNSAVLLYLEFCSLSLTDEFDKEFMGIYSHKWKILKIRGDVLVLQYIG